MAGAGRKLKYPTLEQVIEINRQMILSSGGEFLGNDNIRDRSRLEYILQAIKTPFLEEHLYPSIKDKASALFHSIVIGHPFFDGNKRTAAQAAYEFLRANDVPIQLDQSVVDLAKGVAKKRLGRHEVLEWLHNHQ